MITRSFNTLEPIEDFLNNAAKHGHDVYSVVIGYSFSCNFNLIEVLRKRVNVFTVKINEANLMKQNLRNIGVSNAAIGTLLDVPTLESSGLVPYGINRNHVVIKAMLTGSDVLIFIDTDVYPRALVMDEEGIEDRDLDFIGSHLNYLEDEEVAVTTSDYSGFYIIPPMHFEGMKELFAGLQKEAAYDYLLNHDKHNCLVVTKESEHNPFVSNKILGGNVAIKLEVFKKLLPFFSTVYEVNGTEYLSRGEDTLLGLELNKAPKTKCVDIDTRIFHNTYGNYPIVPDILEDNNIKNRFYYACMGWIGRNPFLNYINGDNLEEIQKIQYENLLIGAPAAAEYFNDDRFLELPEALLASYKQSDRVIEEYHLLAKSWREFINKFFINPKGGYDNESADSESFPA
jgi:hypothetical protein